ncbi:MAG: hypothetical protein FWG49_03890 [Leptospirales bacterium]|nr:hypothetical protein [Leptospirales bacterium]
MKNLSRYLAVIPLIILLSCTGENVMEDKKPGKISEVDRLENFFKRSELDSIKAGNVIEKHRMIQHLTHLRAMDLGGKKYYLLEKDDITEMINAVTEGIYLNYILINKSGEIVYSKYNDNLFGININKGHESTPIKNCFSNREGVHFEDIAYTPALSKNCSLFISSPVYVEGDFHGVLILQIDVKKINEILDAGTEILNRDGIFKVTSFEEKIFSKYPEFDKVSIDTLDRNEVFELNTFDKKLEFSKFNFKSIYWILMNRRM